MHPPSSNATAMMPAPNRRPMPLTALTLRYAESNDRYGGAGRHEREGRDASPHPAHEIISGRLNNAGGDTHGTHHDNRVPARDGNSCDSTSHGTDRAGRSSDPRRIPKAGTSPARRNAARPTTPPAPAAPQATRCA